MNRGLIFIILYIVMSILIISYASAEHQCSDDKYVIFRINGATNAHAEVHDGIAKYNTEICFNEFFSGTINNNPWNCDGDNRILKLSGNTNAHAEGPEGTHYSTDICYGNLRCSSRDSCIGEEKGIARLSSDTNAHLETIESSFYSSSGKIICCEKEGGQQPPQMNCGDNDAEGTEVCDGSDLDGKDCEDLGFDGGTLSCLDDCSGYDTSDCKGTPPPPPEARAYWADTSGAELADGYEVSINQEVRMVLRRANANTEFSYDVFEADCGVLTSPPCSGDDKLREGIKATTNSEGSSYYTLKLTTGDYDTGKSGDLGTNPILDIYFTVNGLSSDNLIKLKPDIVLPPIPPEEEEGCENFEEEDECNIDTEKWEASAENAGFNPLDDCISAWKCECKWDEEACIFSRYEKGSIVIEDGTILTYKCQENVETSDCIDGEAIISYSTAFISNPLCSELAFGSSTRDECESKQIDCEALDGDEKFLSCGSPSLKLNFFGLNQFLSSIFVLLTIYLAINKKLKIFK